MKTLLASFLFAVLLCGSAIAADDLVTLKGVNGKEVTVAVIEVTQRGILSEKEGERVLIRWSQIDMEHLRANYPAIEKKRLDDIDREKNGIFSEVKKEKDAVVLPPAELPKMVTISPREGSAFSARLKAVYIEGIRIERLRGSPDGPLFYRWEDIDEAKLFRANPELKTNKSMATAVPPPLEGKYISVDARWSGPWSTKDSTRKLIVTLRSTAGKSGEVTFDCFHAYNGNIAYEGLARIVKIQAGKVETFELDLPLATYGYKSQGDWVIRVWSDGVLVLNRESQPGLAAKIKRTREPGDGHVFSGS